VPMEGCCQGLAEGCAVPSLQSLLQTVGDAARHG
jgi:hypothetical protein